MKPIPSVVSAALFLILSLASTAAAQPATLATPAAPPTAADRALADYFRAETGRIEAECLKDLKTPQDWQARRGALRQQLLEMLGLHPLPEKTDLKATITGGSDHADFRVENLHFQSRPGLYVTGNLYLPKKADKPAPAVLYVCGHAQVKKGNVSYGNKTAYQHHAAWFASNGYVCLVIDTLQLGEIEGIHHGTHRENMWWWLSRGYTPAGVEAWNCVRALDYLQTRKEVDGSRLGVTGRSGGGAYSWWISAIDDRIKVTVPVAGITDLRNHVVDGAVEGHCDCMYIVNTYRWDYATVAALAAPRPLLMANTDKDGIFPLDGVGRVYWKVRGVYALGKPDEPYRPVKADVGLQVSEGGHADIPELQLAAFRWFNRHLKGEDTPIDLSTAKKGIDPEQLRVFKDSLPPDAINPRVHDTFVATASPPAVPQRPEAWARQRDSWFASLRERTFRGWPADGGGPLDATNNQSAEFEFTSQPYARLRMKTTWTPEGGKPTSVTLHVADADGVYVGSDVHFWLSPRGTGASTWTGDEKKQIQIRRRFMLLGQTVEGMRAWDVRRAIQAIRAQPLLKDVPLTVEANGELAGVALYACLFEPGVSELDLTDLPKTHMQGPHFLNVLRVLDTPQAVAMVAEKTKVRLRGADAAAWQYPIDTAKALDWPADRIEIVPK